MEQPTDFDPPPVRSNWPTTLGIISIVIGILGFLSAASQIANYFIMKSVGSSIFMSSSVSASGSGDEALEEALNQATEQMMADLVKHAEGRIFADFGLLILAVVLFVSGILLMQRYRVSKPILIGWSYAKLVVGLYSVVLMRNMFTLMGNSMGAAFNEEMANATGGSGGPAPFDMVKMYDIIGIVTMVLGAIWVAILPILFLIWFNRTETKQEMASGYGWK